MASLEHFAAMTKPKPIITALTDPVGTARVVKRLAAFAGLTTIHLRRVPHDVQQAAMNQLAYEWAQVLLTGMGINLHLDGEPVRDSGALLVANHRSYVDIIALLASTPCCFLAKGDVADWPVLGKAAVRAGTVFVDRSAKDSRKAARDTMRGLLEDGHTVVVFPEGTTYPGPGCADFKPGAFETALEAGVPVLPVAIEYPHPEDAWGDEGFAVHFNDRFRQPKLNIHLHFGPALTGESAEQVVHESREWISERLHHLWREFEATHPKR
ncbi:MAG: lysophospholipid acyltransferase family protein [bacterium]